ncbi:MAG: hypothetical protein AAB499_00755 [Patescibacteria group bacterium]
MNFPDRGRPDQLHVLFGRLPIQKDKAQENIDFLRQIHPSNSPPLS